LTPVAGAAGGQHLFEEGSDVPVPGVIAALGVVAENFSSDVIVKLELENRGHRVAVVVTGIVVDVGFGGGVAPILAPGPGAARSLDALILRDVLPPSGIPFRR